MAKRVNPYTSTSIGKEVLSVLNNLQAYIKEDFNTNVSHQNINDLAIKKAWDDKENFANELVNIDPDLVAYRQLQEKLKIRGLL